MKRKRLASIYIEEDSELLHFNQMPTEDEEKQGRQNEAADRARTLHQFRNWEVESRKAAMRACALFKGVSEIVIDDLAKLSVLQTFQSGQALQKQGEIIKTFFIVRSGLCHVTKSIVLDEEDAADEESVFSNVPSEMPPFLRSRFGMPIDKEEKIQAAGPGMTPFHVGVVCGGQVIGEPMLFDMRHQIKSPISVVADTPVIVLAIGRSDLKRLHHHFLGQNLQRLRDAFVLMNPPREHLMRHAKRARSWNERKAEIVQENVHPTNPLVRISR